MDSKTEQPTLDKDLIEKATTALLKYVSNQQEDKSNDILADKVHIVWLIVSTHRFLDITKDKPVSIPLKHPLYDASTEICLITKDPQKTFKELVASKNLKRIRKVIGISKLRKKYQPYEAKRQLCNSYDLFMADDRVIPLLPKLLGKCFFQRKKQPIPICLKNEKHFEREILKACNSTYMHFSPGTCLAIKIGTTDMTSSQLLENIITSVPCIVNKIPRKWKNIQSLNIKTHFSTSLPIFNADPYAQITK
ncbi:24263_t:CDS:2 [Dentiscutata erythropus]|uniref:Ribosomal L1 domain-containing protein 1 n=1 Tax=Dentiscutata erythropus TaxID=1348616 RepID=A0A9N9BEW3_9GLOM|nr:24263_t:CDS:2 [Dentiscutata erythropus]